MQIRLDNAKIGLSDNPDPITGNRVLLIQDVNLDVPVGKGVARSGFSIIVPLDPQSIQHLHRQTSPVEIVPGSDPRLN